jgi:putative restriction endonuclease
MEQELEKYCRLFRKLKRASQNGGAPHKPILLLAILEGVRRAEINSNRIYITPELMLCFRELWAKLVLTQHNLNFSLPFFHMRSEPFWKLVCKPNMELAITSSSSIKSFKSLNDALAYAEIDLKLFMLMADPITNGVLNLTLLKQYFSEFDKLAIDYNLMNSIESEILNEGQSEYKTRIKQLEATLTKEEAEEEFFIRGGLFKREIPKIYNYTCAITGMQVVSNSNAQMVDACHIVPFSISKDDTIGNGISLSPTMHRAFDRGLITINEEYLVRVSPTIKEDENPYSLKKLDGKRINLPDNSRYYPLLENLIWHRKERWLV